MAGRQGDLNPCYGLQHTVRKDSSTLCSSEDRQAYVEKELRSSRESGRMIYHLNWDTSKRKKLLITLPGKLGHMVILLTAQVSAFKTCRALRKLQIAVPVTREHTCTAVVFSRRGVCI